MTSPSDEQFGASTPAGRRGLRLQAVVLLASLAVGFGLALSGMLAPASRHSLMQNATTEAIMTGKMEAVVNDILANHLPVGRALRATAGMLRWRVFGSGGAQVWVGQRDWLYIIDEMRTWPDTDAIMAHRADILAQVAQRLRARHVDLVVAIVPDKGRVVVAPMNGPRSSQAERRLPAWLALLGQRGVSAVNLYDSFIRTAPVESLFWRTDTHWSQPGAQLAARTIAARVSTDIDRSHRFVTIEDAQESDGPGDLLRLMSLDGVPDRLLIRLRPAIDRQHRAHTAEMSGQPTAPAAGGLLDETPAPEVALIGSSYSLNANFGGYLEEALGAPVLNTAKLGGGFAKAAAAYFTSDGFRTAPPRLVIWEMPERKLNQPLTEEDAVLAAWAAHG